MALQRCFSLAGLTKLTGLSSLGVVASGVLALASVAAVGGAQPACAADPYPEAVAFSRTAAKAVLNQDGRESCLRGKLTNALLGLSRSCEHEARRDPSLCSLADRAVVVTPMSLAFMDDTSRELLRLIGGAPAPAGVSRARPEPEPMPGDGPTP